MAGKETMPTVLQRDGFRVVIYSNDHTPAHVHVKNADGEALFNLNCPDGPPDLRRVHDLSSREAKRIQAWLADFVPFLCLEWSKIHGAFYVGNRNSG